MQLEQQALWVKEGSATLKKVNGEWVYEGEVSHFTYWNADRNQETVYLNGCVVDEAGAPQRWRVQQVLVDDAGDNDWMADFIIDLAASRAALQPAIALDRIGPIG